jgi:predicted MarR family transcription regulator
MRPAREQRMAQDKEDRHSRRIVSSRHLATEKGWQLSEYEYGLIMAFNAFSRWMVRCMAAAGKQEMSPLDILVLHHVNHRDRQKRLADISFLLNVEDVHTVNYALKKLVKAGLVAGERSGKEIFYSTTEAGRELCEAYRDVREQCLVESLNTMDFKPDELKHVAAMLRTLSGFYDQASRAAASL